MIYTYRSVYSAIEKVFLVLLWNPPGYLAFRLEAMPAPYPIEGRNKGQKELRGWESYAQW